LKICISQGSVAMQLMFGSTANILCIANFSWSSFWGSFGEDMDRSLRLNFFGALLYVFMLSA